MKWLSAVLFLISIPYELQVNCVLKKQADGIKVYTCDLENEKLKTLKAEFLILNTTLDELKQFLLQIGNYPTWQYNMVHAELIQKINDEEIKYRGEINAPWPLEDREIMMHLKVIHDSIYQRMQIEMNTYESSRLVKEGFIRVPLMQGHWNVWGTSYNSLEVEYTLRIDPGGTIPVWLVNLAMAEGPYITFKNLKKQLEN